MKKIKLLLTAAVLLGITAASRAQVPNYVPSSGLVGWWPFNGNAQEFLTNTNPSSNNAVLTNDRFSNPNSAYLFNGSSSVIKYNGSNPLSTIGNSNADFSFNFWIKPNTLSTGTILGSFGWGYFVNLNNSKIELSYIDVSSNWTTCQSLTTLSPNIWHMVTITKNGSVVSLYFDNNLDNVINSIPNIKVYTQFNSWFGANGQDNNGHFNGIIDDIGIWNRALSQQEVNSLYFFCNGSNISIQPTNSTVAIGSTAQFSTNAPAGSTYQWQSNPLELGWQNVVNNTTYSGATTNTLTISNTSVSNHNQPFRAIVNAGGCTDTSDVANIIIGDTCLTTVTDTLIINTTLSLPAPNNENTILIYPNPASDHITIDNGNFAAMAGYSIKIENNAGQQVFQSAINQAQFYVDLSTWTGNGLYFVHLIDPQNNTVTVRKIVLQ